MVTITNFSSSPASAQQRKRAAERLGCGTQGLLPAGSEKGEHCCYPRGLEICHLAGWHTAVSQCLVDARLNSGRRAAGGLPREPLGSLPAAAPVRTMESLWGGWCHGKFETSCQVDLVFLQDGPDNDSCNCAALPQR